MEGSRSVQIITDPDPEDYQKLYLVFKYMGRIRYPRSGIRDPDAGVKKTGSWIRNRTTAFYIDPTSPPVSAALLKALVCWAINSSSFRLSSIVRWSTLNSISVCSKLIFFLSSFTLRCYLLLIWWAFMSSLNHFACRSHTSHRNFESRRFSTCCPSDFFPMFYRCLGFLNFPSRICCLF